MNQNLRRAAKTLVFKLPYGPKLAYLPGRFRLGWSYCAPQFARLLVWLLRSNERQNFTYAITSRNEADIAHTLAVALDADPAILLAYMQEPKTDEALKRHIASAIAASPRRHEADMRVEFGRRLGWYAATRQKKPRLVIETGIDKGLGAVLLCAALARNAAEGHPGRYLGTDNNPIAGYLLSGSYRNFGEILYGDSIESLRGLSETVDIFINDSDHSAIYEYDEYQTIARLLDPRAVILGDNAHSSDSLRRFAQESARRFLFVREEPLDHWYPGAGIGIAFASRPMRG